MVTDLIKNLKINENDYNVGNLRIQPNYIENTSNTKQQIAVNSTAVVPNTKISDYDGGETISIVTKNIDKAEEFFEKLSELKLQSDNIHILFISFNICYKIFRHIYFYIKRIWL